MVNDMRCGVDARDDHGTDGGKAGRGGLGDEIEAEAAEIVIGNEG